MKAWGDLVTEPACKAGWYCSLHGSISKLYSNILKCNINSNFLVLTHQICFTINIHTTQSLKELRLTVILRLSNQGAKNVIYIHCQNTLLQLGEEEDKVLGKKSKEMQRLQKECDLYFIICLGYGSLCLPENTRAL